VQRTATSQSGHTNLVGKPSLADVNLTSLEVGVSSQNQKHDDGGRAEIGCEARRKQRRHQQHKAGVGGKECQL
jgi:hypothetical protein